MNNRDRAADVIRAHGFDPCREPECIAQDLADAGLLAPDLPEPRIDIDGWREWGHKHGNSVALENGRITVHIPDELSRDLTPEEAREVAHAPDMARELLRLRDGVERAVNTAKRQIALTIKAGHVEENGPTCPALANLTDLTSTLAALLNGDTE